MRQNIPVLTTAMDVVILLL